MDFRGVYTVTMGTDAVWDSVASIEHSECRRNAAGGSAECDGLRNTSWTGFGHRDALGHIVVGGLDVGDPRIQRAVHGPRTSDPRRPSAPPVRRASDGGPRGPIARGPAEPSQTAMPRAASSAIAASRWLGKRRSRARSSSKPGWASPTLCAKQGRKRWAVPTLPDSFWRRDPLYAGRPEPVRDRLRLPLGWPRPAPAPRIPSWLRTRLALCW